MSKSDSSSCFTVSDLANGFKPGYLLNLIDDVKIRDGSCKAIQYLFKLTATFLKDADETSPLTLLFNDQKTWSKSLDQAAGSISLARRCFRFIRWTRTVDDLKGILESDGSSLIGVLKRINWMGSMTAMLVEDITTIGRLGLADKSKTESFTQIGTWGWFIESVTGFFIQAHVVNKAQTELYQARKALREGTGSNKKELVIRAYTAHTKYALAQVLFTKWICETTASAHDLGYHTFTKTSMLFSLISACCTVHLQAAKTWPSRQ